MDTLIIAAFLAITLFLGLRVRDRDKTAAGFLLGGRALTLPAFVATTVSTWYGGILGVGEYSWTYGISNWIVFGVPYYLGAFLFAIVLSRRARRAESLTVPDRFRAVYGPRVARCSAVLVFLTTVPAAYMLIMGTLCTASFGIPVAAGIAASAAFVVIYLWRGGFRAVVHTDGFQFVLMFGGFLVLTLVLVCGYGLEPLQSLPPTHLEPTGGQPLSAILVWYVIALSTLAEPNFFQRAFAAKTPEIAQRGLLLSIPCWIVFDLMTTTCGLYARALLPDLDNPVMAFPSLAAAVLPVGILGIFYCALFATVLSTLDSGIFTAATTFGHDLCPHAEPEGNTAPESDAKSRCDAADRNARRTRIGIVIAAILAASVALAAGSVVSIWKIFGSVSAAALLIPILTTYYPKYKMSRKGAVILMILSGTTTLAWFLCAKWMGKNPLGLDPLLPGGAVSIACYALDRAFGQTKTPEIAKIEGR